MFLGVTGQLVWSSRGPLGGYIGIIVVTNGPFLLTGTVQYGTGRYGSPLLRVPKSWYNTVY